MKKFLVIGPSKSSQYFYDGEYPEQIKLDSNIKIIGIHRVFPHLNIKLDYWTWSDPDAAIDGLRIYTTNQTKECFFKLPQIILPIYQKSLDSFRNNCGTSPLLRNPKRQSDRNLYHNTIQMLDRMGKITWIENAISTKTIPTNHVLFKDPQLRFNNERTYFGSVPFEVTSKIKDKVIQLLKNSTNL